MASLTNRMVRAARLDIKLYEEVEADRDAIKQAIAVVVIASVAAGIGDIMRGGIMGLIGAVLASLIGWMIMAGLIYVIGAKLMPEPQTKADFGQLARTLGFAYAPGALYVFGIVPFLGPLLAFAIGIWTLVAAVIAVRQALDYKSTLRAVGVCIVGWIAMIVLRVMVLVFVGGAQAIAAPVL